MLAVLPIRAPLASYSVAWSWISFPFATTILQPSKEKPNKTPKQRPPSAIPKGTAGSRSWLGLGGCFAAVAPLQRVVEARRSGHGVPDIHDVGALAVRHARHIAGEHPAGGEDLPCPIRPERSRLRLCLPLFTVLESGDRS